MRPRLISVVLAVVCLLCAGALWSSSRDARSLRSAERAGAAGQYDVAQRRAARIHRSPFGARAKAVEAYAVAAQHRWAAASGRFRDAVEASPNDAELRRDWARVLFAAGQARSARVQLGRALALDPRLEVPPELGLSFLVP